MCVGEYNICIIRWLFLPRCIWDHIVCIGIAISYFIYLMWWSWLTVSNTNPLVFPLPVSLIDCVASRAPLDRPSGSPLIVWRCPRVEGSRWLTSWWGHSVLDWWQEETYRVLLTRVRTGVEKWKGKGGEDRGRERGKKVWLNFPYSFISSFSLPLLTLSSLSLSLSYISAVFRYSIVLGRVWAGVPSQLRFFICS